MENKNYGGLDSEFTAYETAEIVVLPVPYDGTSTWLKGADKGPDAILEASANMELYDIETDSEVYTHGIATLEPVTEASSPEAMSQEDEKQVENIEKQISTDKEVISVLPRNGIRAIKSLLETIKDMTDKYEALNENVLQEIAARYDRLTDVEENVEIHQIEEEILRYAKEQRPKVIIMGTRGKSQKDIDLIGSVTAEIIDRSRTAVLAIPENTPFKEFNEVKRIAFLTNFDQRDLIAFEAFFNTWKSFHFSVSLIHLAESKDTWNEIKLAGIKDYFQKQYPGLEIHYDVVMNDNLLKGLDQYIKDNQIDIITLTSYKRNIFARLFNPSIARKMIFHSDTPLLVING